MTIVSVRLRALGSDPIEYRSLIYFVARRCQRRVPNQPLKRSVTGVNHILSGTNYVASQRELGIHCGHRTGSLERRIHECFDSRWGDDARIGRQVNEMALCNASLLSSALVRITVCGSLLVVLCVLSSAEEQYIVSSVDGNVNVYNLSDN